MSVMPCRIARGLALSVLSLALAAPLAAQAPGRWGCTADSLSGFNCARYYDGTVTLASELKGANNTVQQTFRVTATVTGGRVSCHVQGSDAGDFSGPGALAVTHGATQTAGGAYDISIWCPESEGQPVRRRSSPVIQIQHQQATDYATLAGRDAHEHPDADAANNLSGTETITWQLRRP